MDKTAGEYHFTRLDTVVFGAGKVESLGRELSRRGAKRALIVTGKTLGHSKLLDQVKDAAGAALAGVFTGAAQHVPSQTVTELVAEARRVGADAMVSFGGGSPIDTVKNAAWQLIGGRAGSRTIDFAGGTAEGVGGGEILPYRDSDHAVGRRVHARGRRHRRIDQSERRRRRPAPASEGRDSRSRADGRDARVAVGVNRDARARSCGRRLVLDAPSARHRHAGDQGDRAAERASAAVAARRTATTSSSIACNASSPRGSRFSACRTRAAESRTRWAIRLGRCGTSRTASRHASRCRM